MLLLPLPEVEDSLHQSELLLAVQFVLVVILTIWLLYSGAKEMELSDKLRVTPSCVIVTVFDSSPDLTVIVAVRAVFVLAVQLMAIVLLPFPDVALSVHQLALLLAVQSVFVVIERSLLLLSGVR
jgi:hypothetical protein